MYGTPRKRGIVKDNLSIAIEEIDRAIDRGKRTVEQAGRTLKLAADALSTDCAIEGTDCLKKISVIEEICAIKPAAANALGRSERTRDICPRKLHSEDKRVAYGALTAKYDVEPEVEVEAPKMPSVECEMQVQVEAPKPPKMPSVECEVEVEVEAPKMPSVECEVQVQVEAPKMPSVECEVEAEVEAPEAPKVVALEMNTAAQLPVTFASKTAVDSGVDARFGFKRLAVMTLAVLGLEMLIKLHAR